MVERASCFPYFSRPTQLVLIWLGDIQCPLLRRSFYMLLQEKVHAMSEKMLCFGRFGAMVSVIKEV